MSPAPLFPCGGIGFAGTLLLERHILSATCGRNVILDLARSSGVHFGGDGDLGFFGSGNNAHGFLTFAAGNNCLDTANRFLAFGGGANLTSGLTPGFSSGARNAAARNAAALAGPTSFGAASTFAAGFAGAAAGCAATDAAMTCGADCGGGLAAFAAGCSGGGLAALAAGCGATVIGGGGQCLAGGDNPGDLLGLQRFLCGDCGDLLDLRRFGSGDLLDLLRFRCRDLLDLRGGLVDLRSFGSCNVLLLCNGGGGGLPSPSVFFLLCNGGRSSTALAVPEDDVARLATPCPAPVPDDDDGTPCPAPVPDDDDATPCPPAPDDDDATPCPAPVDDDDATPWPAPVDDNDAATPNSASCAALCRSNSA